MGENQQGSSACADITEPEQEKSGRGDHHRPGHLRVSCLDFIACVDQCVDEVLLE